MRTSISNWYFYRAKLQSSHRKKIELSSMGQLKDFRIRNTPCAKSTTVPLRLLCLRLRSKQRDMLCAMRHKMALANSDALRKQSKLLGSTNPNKHKQTISANISERLSLPSCIYIPKENTLNRSFFSKLEHPPSKSSASSRRPTPPASRQTSHLRRRGAPASGATGRGGGGWFASLWRRNRTDFCPQNPGLGVDFAVSLKTRGGL